MMVGDLKAAMTNASSATSASPRRLPLRTSLVVAGAVALAVRWIWLDRQSYHIDELLDRNVALMGWGKITNFGDGFPPGYYYLEKSWISLFGVHSIRALALLLGMLTWTFLVLAARRLWTDATMVSTAWVAALAPALIWFSQEMRPHAMLICVASATLWAGARLVREPTSRSATILAAIIVLGAWIHYFYIPFAGAAVLGTWVWLRGNPAARALRIRMSLIAGLGALPLVLLVGNDLGLQQTDTGREFGLSHIAYGLLSLVTGTTVGPSVGELRLLSVHDAFIRTLPWLLLLAVPGVLIVALLWARRRDPAFRFVTFVLVTSLLAVLVMIYGGDTGVRVRYLAVGAAPLVLLVSAALTEMPRARRGLAAGVLAVVSIVAIYNRNDVAAYKVADFRGVVHFIDDSQHADALIVVNQDVQGVVLDEYLGHPRSLRIPAVVTADDLAHAMTRIDNASSGHGYWVVYSLPWFGDPSRLLLHELVQSHHATLVKQFPGVDVYWVDTP